MAKHILVFILTFGILFSAVLTKTSNAEEIVPRMGGGLIQKLPSPLKEFIEDAKNIEDVLPIETAREKTELRTISVKSLIQSLDNWFGENIGVTFTKVVKVVIGLGVWFLNILISAFKLLVRLLQWLGSWF